MTLWIDILIAVFGAAVGSFLNVCISRIPEGHSIVTPPSACPACGHGIRFYDNLPLISYVLLWGRCRDCRTAIPWRYPLVESLAGALALFLFWKYGFTLKFPAASIFVAVLIVVAFIDMDHQIIPDSITLPGMPFSMLAAVFMMDIPFLESLSGLIAGGGVLYLIALSYAFLRKREGMGGGDIKLLAMIGAFLGWKSLICVMLISSLSGVMVGITLIALRKQGMKDAVPFGPFLALAAVVWLFWGDLFMGVLLFEQY